MKLDEVIVRRATASDAELCWCLAAEHGHQIKPEHQENFISQFNDADRTFLIVGRDEGFFGVLDRGMGIGEIHTVMAPSIRGARAEAAGKKAALALFAVLGFSKLTSMCATRESLVFARRFGFSDDVRVPEGMWVSLTRLKWFYVGHRRFSELGRALHATLNPTANPNPDLFWDSALGLMVVLSERDYGDAQNFYNTWAAQFGYPFVTIWPPTSTGHLILELDGRTLFIKDRTFSLTCPPQS